MSNEELSDDIEEYIAGFFDGDGTVKFDINESDSHRLGYKIQPDVTIPQRVHSDQAYVAGFLDSDGGLDVKVSNRDGDFQLSPRVHLTQKEGIPVLLLIQRVVDYCKSIGIGEPSVYNSHTDTSVRITIRGLDDIEQFLEGIEKYCTIKRRQINIMLNEIIPRLRNGDHLNKKGFIETMEKIDEMNKSKGGVRGKYNADYFKDLWEEDLEQMTAIEDFYENELDDEEESIFKE